jgi:hypothetical protein
MHNTKNAAGRLAHITDPPSTETQPVPHRLPPVYVVAPEERLVSVTFGKSVCIRDIESYATALRADPLFEPGFSEIIDLSEVEELQLDAEHALDLADHVDPFSIGARRAFVARSSVQIHAARMHQLLRNDERNTRIFAFFADAKSWIVRGVPA